MLKYLCKTVLERDLLFFGDRKILTQTFFWWCFWYLERGRNNREGWVWKSSFWKVLQKPLPLFCWYLGGFENEFPLSRRELSYSEASNHILVIFLHKCLFILLSVLIFIHYEGQSLFILLLFSGQSGFRVNWSIFQPSTSTPSFLFEKVPKNSYFGGLGFLTTSSIFTSFLTIFVFSLLMIYWY